MSVIQTTLEYVQKVRHPVGFKKADFTYTLIEVWHGTHWNSIHFSHLTISCIKSFISCLFCSCKQSKRPDSFQRLLYFRLYLSGHKLTISDPQTSFYSTSGTPKRFKAVCFHADPSMHFMKPFLLGVSISPSPGLHIHISNTTHWNKRSTLLESTWVPVKKQRALTECLIPCKVFTKHKSRAPDHWSNLWPTIKSNCGGVVAS